MWRIVCCGMSFAFENNGYILISKACLEKPGNQPLPFRHAICRVLQYWFILSVVNKLSASRVTSMYFFAKSEETTRCKVRRKTIYLFNN